MTEKQIPRNTVCFLNQIHQISETLYVYTRQTTKAEIGDLNTCGTRYFGAYENAAVSHLIESFITRTYYNVARNRPGRKTFSQIKDTFIFGVVVEKEHSRKTMIISVVAHSNLNSDLASRRLSFREPAVTRRPNSVWSRT